MNQNKTMKIGLLYFSATTNTEKIARVIGDRLRDLGWMVYLLSTPYCYATIGKPFVTLHRYESNALLFS